MNGFEIPWHRYATIAALAAKTDSRLGRTALMKLCYFLQELRGVDLGYDFRLYTYGPFDAQVLDDLSYAQFLEAVEEQSVPCSGRHGYVITPGRQAGPVLERARKFLERNEGEIDDVVREFAGFSAASLELMSTLVYVDRENAAKEITLPLEGLVEKVLQIKLRFRKESALKLAESLRDRGTFRAVSG